MGSVLICVIAYLNIQGGQDHWRGIPEADARGYYAWLPALFIYQDLHFGFYDSVEVRHYYNENLTYEYRVGYEDQVVNKYFAGTAFMQTPFFILTHWTVKLLGGTADGYAKPYMMMIGFAALGWLVLGLYWSDRLMQSYRVSDIARSLAIPGFLFGTNLFYYAVIEPGMSHAYSFSLFAGIFYGLKRYAQTSEGKHLIMACLLWGLAIAVRPVNGIAIFALPFLWGGPRKMVQLLAQVIRLPLLLLGSGGTLLVFPLFQGYLHWLQTGTFGIWSYPGETFDFLHPEFWNILFSFRKGLFVYTPLWAIIIAGACWLSFRKPEYWAYLFFFLIQVWVFASWWCWWYGGSFSGRPFLDFGVLGLLFLGLTGDRLLSIVRGKVLWPLVLLGITALCQFQIYQYRYYLIHWENMDREKYFQVWLKLP